MTFTIVQVKTRNFFIFKDSDPMCRQRASKFSPHMDKTKLGICCYYYWGYRLSASLKLISTCLSCFPEAMEDNKTKLKQDVWKT